MTDEKLIASLLGPSADVLAEHFDLSPLVEEGISLGMARLLRHGDFARFLGATKALPSPRKMGLLDEFAPRALLEEEERDLALRELEKLTPFRKGPFLIGDRLLDAEWRSNLKWDRLESLASPFEGRRVLDVGAGNGYYLFRLEGRGAKLAVGIEPSVLYTCQFLALGKLLVPERIAFLPATLEELGSGQSLFDTVLSMGVLYHRKDPKGHLEDLARHLRPGGELVVETLIVEHDDEHCLVPPDRYAMMRNVHALPSSKLLVRWLDEAGLRDIELGPIVRTTSDEQRSTPFMTGPSLRDFLDPNDEMSTIEGLPAPLRLMVRANKI